MAAPGPSDPKRTLPAAALTPAGAVWLSDIARIAVSNGSTWIRQDTGASV